MLGSFVYLVYLGLPIHMPEGEDFSQEFVADSQRDPASVKEVQQPKSKLDDLLDYLPWFKDDNKKAPKIAQVAPTAAPKVASAAQSQSERKSRKIAKRKKSRGEKLAEKDKDKKEDKKIEDKKKEEEEEVAEVTPEEDSDLPSDNPDESGPEVVASDPCVENPSAAGCVAALPTPTPIPEQPGVTCPALTAGITPTTGAYGNAVDVVINPNISSATVKYCVADVAGADPISSLNCSHTLGAIPCTPDTDYVGAITLAELVGANKGRCVVYEVEGCGQKTEVKTSLYFVDGNLPALTSNCPVSNIQTRELWDASKAISYQSTDFNTAKPQRDEIYGYMLNFPTDPFLDPAVKASDIFSSFQPEDDGTIQMVGVTNYTKVMFADLLVADTVTTPYIFPDASLNSIGYGDNYFMNMVVNPEPLDAKAPDDTKYIAYSVCKVTQEDFGIQGFSAGGGSYVPNAQGVNLFEGGFGNFGVFDGVAPEEAGRAPAAVGPDTHYLEAGFFNIVN
jgi:hypothetical protein